MELHANITIPDITVETDSIDFNKVLIGQRKTIFVRFTNDKEVACEWNVNTRADISAREKNQENRFAINPTSGFIAPGQKQTVELTFMPTTEKPYTYKFSLLIKENPKQLFINVKGVGTSINLECIPEKINIGPVLPYENFAYSILQVCSTSKYI